MIFLTACQTEEQKELAKIELQQKKLELQRKKQAEEAYKLMTRRLVKTGDEIEDSKQNQTQSK